MEIQAGSINGHAAEHLSSALPVAVFPVAYRQNGLFRQLLQFRHDLTFLAVRGRLSPFVEDNGGSVDVCVPRIFRILKPFGTIDP